MGHKKQPQIRIKGLNAIPVKRLSPKEQKPFIEKVENILSITKTEDYQKRIVEQGKVNEYEKQIDRMVYNLYGLTEEEITGVENAIG